MFPFRKPLGHLSWFLLPLALSLAGCSQLGSDGFSRAALQAPSPNPALAAIQLVEVNDAVARELAGNRKEASFSEVFGNQPAPPSVIGRGDSLEVSLWEAPPALLFSAAAMPQAGVAVAPESGREITLPIQIVDADGQITVPFAGNVTVAGLPLSKAGQAIADRLKGLAHQPQALVRETGPVTDSVTVVGDVTTSSRVAITPKGERLLDALAAAGGVRQPVNKTTIQLTRGELVESMPLDYVIRDPRQNIPLHAGDVVTALFQPLTFTALGATGKSDEVGFESQGISLAQALARVNGLNDQRADAQGVFIFRFEPRDALAWPHQPVQDTADGRVPVVYQINLRNPTSFFVVQNFQMKNKDLLYVSSAPAAELQKFLNLLFSVVYPISSIRSL